MTNLEIILSIYSIISTVLGFLMAANTGKIIKHDRENQKKIIQTKNTNR